MSAEFSDHKLFYFTAFFFLGLFNNTGYVVIGTAAADLAKKFGYDDLMAAFNLALVTFSVITKFINSWL
jgi:hypothetical protein